jgi:DNA-binding NarL/FixJ family response regulator
MKRITVLLAEDHTVVREGLRKLLACEAEIEVVGEAETGRQALELAKKLRPAVIVMDIAMPQLNGLECARQVRKAVPGTKVLILSAHGDDPYVERAIACGADGFLVKQTSAHELARAIRELHGGRTIFSPSIAKRFQKEQLPGKPGQPKKEIARLTSREVEVLQLIAEGEPNKQVAGDLGISIKTVEKHRQRLMEKLKIHDTAGLTRYAIGAGIIDSNVEIFPGR